MAGVITNYTLPVLFLAAGRPIPILIMHLLDLSGHSSFLHQMFPQHSINMEGLNLLKK